MSCASIIVNDILYSLPIEAVPVQSMLYCILTGDTLVPIDTITIGSQNVKGIPCISDNTIEHFGDLVLFINDATVRRDRIDALLENLEYFMIMIGKVFLYSAEFTEIKLKEDWFLMNRYNLYFSDIFADPYKGLVRLGNAELLMYNRRFNAMKAYLLIQSNYIHKSKDADGMNGYIHITPMVN